MEIVSYGDRLTFALLLDFRTVEPSVNYSYWRSRIRHPPPLCAARLPAFLCVLGWREAAGPNRLAVPGKPRNPSQSGFPASAMAPMRILVCWVTSFRRRLPEVNLLTCRYLHIQWANSRERRSFFHPWQHHVDLLAQAFQHCFLPLYPRIARRPVISFANRLACPTTRLVASSNWR